MPRKPSASLRSASKTDDAIEAREAELLAFEDDHFAVEAKSKGSASVDPTWHLNKNLHQLRIIDRKFGVRKNDPRAYSIKKFTEAREAINDTFELDADNREAVAKAGGDPGYGNENFRWQMRLIDCWGRHFPGLFPLPGFANPLQDEETIDRLTTRAKLWAFITQAIETYKATRKTPLGKSAIYSSNRPDRDICIGYAAMSKLGVPGVPPRPYPELTAQQSVDAMEQVAYWLERDEQGLPAPTPQIEHRPAPQIVATINNTSNANYREEHYNAVVAAIDNSSTATDNSATYDHRAETFVHAPTFNGPAAPEVAEPAAANEPAPPRDTESAEVPKLAEAQESKATKDVEPTEAAEQALETRGETSDDETIATSTPTQTELPSNSKDRHWVTAKSALAHAITAGYKIQDSDISKWAKLPNTFLSRPSKVMNARREVDLISFLRFLDQHKAGRRRA